MAFFSQKEHKVKRSHSAERTKSHHIPSTTPTPSLPTRTRSSRPTTFPDPLPVNIRVQEPDHKPPIPKLNTVPSKHSLRRVPVPSLSIQDLDKLTYDRTRTSPIIPSSRSTSISGKSSIADIGGVYNATSSSSRTKPDRIKPADNTRISPTPPQSSPHPWELSSGTSRNPAGAYDPEKTVCHISDLAVLASSPKQVPVPLSSSKSGSQKPQRAVLRRKSSAKRPGPQPNNQGLTSKKSKPDFGISSAAVTPQRVVASAHQISHSVSTPPSWDTAHRVRRSTSDERDPRSLERVSPSPSPRGLTPAGAVVAAYKEQEERKKDLKEFVRANAHDITYGDSCDENGGVYYTVFGSSGTVVAVGVPEDEGWSRNGPNNTPNKSKSLSRKPSLGGLTKLTKKSSTKAKKNNTYGCTSESECGNERVTREGKGRSSFHGRRSTSVPSKHRSKKSLGVAIESTEVGQIWDSPQSSTAQSKSGGWSLDDPSPSAGGKIWKLMKRLSTGGLREKYQAQEAAPPVPALPDGLHATPPKLKSRVHSVPHSPNESKPPASRYVRGRSSFGDVAFTNRHRSTQGFPSLTPSPRPPISNSGKNPSHRRQSTNTRSSSPVSSDMASSKFWQKSRSSSVSTFEDIPPLPERVVLSEPILSPLELSKLEREQAMAQLSSSPSTVTSHSPTASSSNHHGNAVLVIRKPSPRGLQMQTSGEDSETDGMSTSEFAALPTPPRHHRRSNPHAVYHQSNGSSSGVGSVSTSPTIPMFSTQDVVNQFHSSKGNGVGMSTRSSSTSQSPAMSSDEFGIVAAVQPPPRPRRSEKRKTLISNLPIPMRISSDRARDDRDGHRSRGVLPSKSASLPQEGTFGHSAGRNRDEDGRSYGTFGRHQSKGIVELVRTSRDSNSSRKDFKSSSSIHSRSPLRFKEIGSVDAGKEKQMLTEKEKADKWEDLLEKSDRAGGTIHIGGAKLASDSLRFSDYSTLTALAL